MYINEEGSLFPHKSCFSTLGSVIEFLLGRRGQISLVQGDILRVVLGFQPKVIHDEYNLSDYLVNLLSFDSISLGIDIAHGMIFKGRRS